MTLPVDHGQIPPSYYERNTRGLLLGIFWEPNCKKLSLHLWGARLCQDSPHIFLRAQLRWALLINLVSQSLTMASRMPLEMLDRWSPWSGTRFPSWSHWVLSGSAGWRFKHLWILLGFEKHSGLNGLDWNASRMLVCTGLCSMRSFRCTYNTQPLVVGSGYICV